MNLTAEIERRARDIFDREPRYTTRSDDSDSNNSRGHSARRVSSIVSKRFRSLVDTTC